MKRFLSAGFVAVCLFTACSKDKTIATPTNNNNGSGGGQDTAIQYLGKFMPTNGISVSGSAKIISTAIGYAVLLDSFMVSQGPDLKVYLSKQNTAIEFVNLGALQSNNGNSTYTIPATVDLQLYPYVLIHCQQYNQLFAIAQLK